MRAATWSRPPIQYSWKNVRGLAAMTSASGLLANELSPIAVPRAAAARATATSPSGCTACTPVGEMSTGSATGCPMTMVAMSRPAGSPATWGTKPSSSNAATLSARVSPFSVPASSAPYTDGGSRFRARRCATATVSNHALRTGQSSGPGRARSPRSGCQARAGRTGILVRARSEPVHTPAP